MKKYLFVVFCLLIVLFAVGCVHYHSWIDATCTEPKTCSVCSATEGEALGHDWKDATCTEPKTCTVCNATEGSQLYHKWTDPDCTNPKVCKICGFVVVGSKLGHDAPDVSCTESGICARCGEEVPPLGHSFIDATCTEAAKCKVCGYVDGEPLGHTTDNGICARCNLYVFKTVSGYGDDVVSNIETGEGLYRVHFKNYASRNFVVWVYDSDDYKDLAVNEIGNYDGYYFLDGESPFVFEIESSGNWEFTIEKLQLTDDQSFSGWGDFVTDIFDGLSGTWEITHDGKHHFAVWLYTTKGKDLLVNEIGKYNGKKLAKIPTGSNAILVITADGNWSISPVD